MADITKCNNKSCLIKETCWRWLAPVNKKWQSYALFEYIDLSECVNGCQDYWEYRKIERVGKIYKAKVKEIDLTHKDECFIFQLPSKYCKCIGNKDRYTELQFDNGDIISLDKSLLDKYFGLVEDNKEEV